MKTEENGLQPPHVKSIPVGAILIFLLMAVVLGGIGLYLFTDHDQPLAIGGRPQDFTLKTFNGEQLDTADLRSKVLLIHFWASWCSTCEEEAQLLEKAWEIVKAEEVGDVAFLGLAYQDTETEATDFLSEVSLTFPNGLDIRGNISKIYRVTKVPETYILDAEGVLRVAKIGPFASVDEILAGIEIARSSEDR